MEIPNLFTQRKAGRKDYHFQMLEKRTLNKSIVFPPMTKDNQTSTKLMRKKIR